MSKKSKKVLKWAIPLAVLSLTCASAGVVSGCKKKEHVHHYEWTYEEGGSEHWKACPDDGAEQEGTRGEHVFVAGECECGAKEPVVEKKYGSAHGEIKLHKLGGYDTDFSDVTVDMGDDVEPVLDRQTGRFTVANVEAGKNHTLTISKPGYKSYSLSVQVEEGQDAPIGGTRGVVLEYEVFGTLLGWDGELHDYSHANDANPYIRFLTNPGGKSLNSLTKDSYTDVSASLNIIHGNSDHAKWHLQGLALVFEDGKHIVVRYRSDKNGIEITNNQWGDQTNGLKAADSLFGADAGLNEWGERLVHTMTTEEAADVKDEGLPVTAVLKDGKLYVLFNDAYAYSYELPEGYADKKAQVAYFAFNAASNAIFSYEISETLPALESALDIDVKKPAGGEACAVTTADPEKKKYGYGEEIELTFNAPAGFKLDTLTVNGVDRYNDVKEGKLTVLADRATIAVSAAFAKEEPVTLDVAVKGKMFGVIAPFAQGTKVKFSGVSDEFEVNASGKITGSLIKGRYTVSVDKYVSQEIVVDENLTEVVLEYDAFKVVRWDSDGQDMSHVNDAQPYMGFKGPGSSLNVVSKEQLYNDVSLSVTLKASDTTDGARQQGVILQFEDGKAAILNINTDGDPRLQFRPHLFDDENKSIGLRSAFTKEWVEFRNVTSAEVDKYCSETGIKLTLQRHGSALYLFIDGVFKGRADLPEEYADDKAGIGIFAYGAKVGSKWYFEVSETLQNLAVEITDTTGDDAGGTISISSGILLGDKVTITVSPDATHVLDRLEVSGGITPTPEADGTYTFIASELAYTVKAVFGDKPAQQAEANVSGIDLGNVSTVIADDTVVTFTPETGAATQLTVTDGKVSGILLPGRYTVSVEGYHSAEVTVGADGAFADLTDGIKLEKVILTFNKIGEPEGNLKDGGFKGNVADSKGMASAGKIVTTGNGSIYEWTEKDFDDVAMSVTIKKQAGEQGLIIKFYNVSIDNRSQNDVRVRIQEYTDNATQEKHNKIQWDASSWFWGTHNAVANAWDFMDNGGENYAVPLSDALVAKYNGDGLKLTLARKGSMVYVLIDGEIYAAQMLDDRFADKKVRAAFFAKEVAGEYEIPVEITTDVDALLAGKTDANGVMGVLGKWTVTENTLAVTGDGYAEFAPAVAGTKESLSVTLKDGNSKAGKKAQGVAYRFADGHWLAARMESNDEATYIQYADDVKLPKLGGSLTGWVKVKDFDKSRLADGVNLKMVRDGRYIYLLLDDELIDLRVLDAKYADMEGVMATTIEQGTGAAYAYEYKSGDDVTVPEKYAVTFSGVNQGYTAVLDKDVVNSGESVTLTIQTIESTWWTAWSKFPTEIKVNGVAVDMSTVTRESIKANVCKYTLTVSNITANTEIVVTIGTGTKVAYDASVNNDEYGTIVCDMENDDKDPCGYYWNDGCTWTITAKEGYELEKLVIGEGDNAREITEGWTQNGNAYTYSYTVDGDIKVVAHFKAAEGEQPGVNAVSKLEWADMGTSAQDLDLASYNYKYYEIYGETTTAQTGKNDLIIEENVSAAAVAEGNFPITISGSGATVNKVHAINTGSSFTFKIKVVKGMEKIQIFFAQESGATLTATYTMNGNTANTTATSNGAMQMVKISLDTSALEDGKDYEITVTVSSSADGLQCGACGIRSTAIDNNVPDAE